MLSIRLDKETAKWMHDYRHDWAQKSVVYCWACGMYYMPELGHKCQGGGANDREAKH